MRPLVPTSSALAAVALCGALLAGTSIRPSERADGGVASPGASAPTSSHSTTPPDASHATRGFYGGAAPAWPDAPGTTAPSATATPFASATGDAPRPPSAPLPTSPSGALLRRTPELQDAPDVPHHEFYFTRAIYSDRRSSLRSFGRFGRGRGSWSIDYPKADEQFMVMVDHLMHMDLYPESNAVRLDDPSVRRFPWLYALEVGAMRLSDAEVRGLRDYLHAGGFLVIDDFWGPYEWANFEREISRVLPGRPIVELDLDHPIFHTFYDIEEILQVPNVRQGRSGGPTWEQGGRVPHVLGIFDDHDRLMVVINYNTDLGDAWEWAEDPFYPLKYSRFAAEMGINMIVYGMSH